MPIPAPAPPPPRRTDRPLPAHRHLPGDRPPNGWAPGPDFAWGCDLFDQRHLWEAHEVWELEWRALPRGTAGSDLLQGLICAAAFTLKRHQSEETPGLREAARRLLARARAHLGRVPAADARGIAIPELLARLERFDAGGPWPVLPDR